MWKKVVLAVVCLIIGFISGYIFVMAHEMPPIAKMMFMLQEKEIIEMEDAAKLAYHNESNEVAIWALENYIQTLDKVKKERSSTKAENPYVILLPTQSLVFAHTRLGQLYKNMGNTEKSKYHFEQAISYAKSIKMPWETEESLLSVLSELDKDSNQIPRK
jgi:hypothetical protein